jgi:hypothetical protein
VLVPFKFSIIEPNGIHGENRFSEERGARHTLTKCAMAGKRAQGRLTGSETNFAAKAATFKYNGHGVHTPGCVTVNTVIRA